MGILKNFPGENLIQADIIQVLKDRGGKLSRTEVIRELVIKWHLTPDELSYCTPGGCVYCEHRIDGAANRLRSAGKITMPERGTWQLEGKSEEKTSRLTHDELVQKLKEMGEILGKIAQVKWGRNTSTIVFGRITPLPALDW